MTSHHGGKTPTAPFENPLPWVGFEKPVSGLLKRPRPKVETRSTVVHSCALPGWWYCLRHSVQIRDLWRCPDCQRCYRRTEEWLIFCGWSTWTEVVEDEWFAAGGRDERHR